VATPTLSTHVLPGALGEIFVDVRAAGRSQPRPAVVIVHGFKGFKDWASSRRWPVGSPARGSRRCRST